MLFLLLLTLLVIVLHRSHKHSTLDQSFPTLFVLALLPVLPVLQLSLYSPPRRPNHSKPVYDRADKQVCQPLPPLLVGLVRVGPRERGEGSPHPAGVCLVISWPVSLINHWLRLRPHSRRRKRRKRKRIGTKVQFMHNRGRGRSFHLCLIGNQTGLTQM